MNYVCYLLFHLFIHNVVSLILISYNQNYSLNRITLYVETGSGVMTPGIFKRENHSSLHCLLLHRPLKYFTLYVLASGKSCPVFMPETHPTVCGYKKLISVGRLTLCPEQSCYHCRWFVGTTEETCEKLN